MKTGLTIEEYDIAIDNVSLNNVTVLETIRDCHSVAELEVFFETVATASNIVGTRVCVAPIPHSLPESMYVEACHTFGIRQNFCNTFWDGNLVYSEVRVRGDHSTS